MLNLNEEGEAKKEYNSPIHHDGEDLGHSYIIKILPKSCRLRIGAYRDGVKRKGNKIRMGL